MYFAVLGGGVRAVKLPEAIMSRDWSRIRSFRADEWGKDPERVDFRLVEILDEVRCDAGVPIHIHVAWDDGGHSSKSQHYLGKAVDFHFGDGLTHLEELALLSCQPEIRGLGFYPGWRPRPGWHADLRADPKRLLWVRSPEGSYFYGFRDLARAIDITDCMRGA